ncbi:hypothetical protein [Halostagnicola sp. A56]|uniref:hypothetical protein n=1 Tax=Halostagnicola sp. A56 TaxID=1495067 RepID=UPI0012E2851C|nr:hypothetical protein [Halostagnicola sp. A56]
MSNTDSPKDPWKAHTQIDRETFLKHIFKCAEWEKGRLGISVYCVEPSYNAIETGPFIEYVGNKYPQFVFSKTEINDMLDSGKWPSKEAQKRSDFPDNPSTDGKLGELILFLFVDLYLSREKCRLFDCGGGCSFALDQFSKCQQVVPRNSDGTRDAVGVRRKMFVLRDGGPCRRLGLAPAVFKRSHNAPFGSYRMGFVVVPTSNI